MATKNQEISTKLLSRLYSDCINRQNIGYENPLLFSEFKLAKDGRVSKKLKRLLIEQGYSQVKDNNLLMVWDEKVINELAIKFGSIDNFPTNEEVFERYSSPTEDKIFIPCSNLTIKENLFYYKNKELFTIGYFDRFGSKCEKDNKNAIIHIVLTKELEAWKQRVKDNHFEDVYKNNLKWCLETVLEYDYKKESKSSGMLLGNGEEDFGYFYSPIALKEVPQRVKSIDEKIAELLKVKEELNKLDKKVSDFGGYEKLDTEIRKKLAIELEKEDK